VLHEHDAVGQVFGPDAREQSLCGPRTQRREAEAAARIAREHELHRTRAQAAVAVEEHDGPCCRGGSCCRGGVCCRGAAIRHAFVRCHGARAYCLTGPVSCAAMFARTLGHLSCVLLPTVAGFTQAPPIDPGSIDPAVIDPAGVPGALLLGGGGKLPSAIYERFLELAGGADARIVLVPTASARADEPGGLERTLETWRRDHPGVHFDVLHTRDRSTADREDFTAPLRAATGVWFGGGAQERLAAAYAGTRVEDEVLHLLARGGIVGGSSAGTAIQTRTMIQEGKDPPVLATGLPLLPLAISDQHFTQRQRLPRLLMALRLAEGHFGIGVDEGTAALVRGRRIEVLGEHTVTLALAARNGRDEWGGV
jgi:cyanophycinase